MKKLLSLLLCLALAAGVAPSALAAERPEGVPSAGAYETETESESGTDEYAVSALTLDGNSVRFNDFGRYVHDSRYASRKVLKGIDVSVFQGDIDWGAVRNDGVDFAIVRIGGRFVSSGDLYSDTSMAQNLSGAIGQGIAAGAYFFSQAVTEEEAREEAAEAIRLLGSYAGQLSLPIYMDMEYFGTSGRLYEAKLSAQEHTKIALAFCRAIEEAGYKAGLYVGLCSFPINASEIADAGYEIWHAHWTERTTASPVYTVWQFSSVGSVAGIRGSVDLNFRYVPADGGSDKDSDGKDTGDKPGENGGQKEPVSFSDVPSGAWYHDSVEYVVGRGLFLGVGDGKFGPSAAMNREMFVTVLYRLAGEPDVTGESAFTDVADASKWYYKAVLWGAQTGIVSGIGDGKFGVGRALSRQEMVTLLARYAAQAGLAVDSGAGLDSFPDGGKTADWAAAAMRWAVDSGIISGVAESGGSVRLAPSGTTTRAQVAAVIERFTGLLEEPSKK